MQITLSKWNRFVVLNNFQKKSQKAKSYKRETNIDKEKNDQISKETVHITVKAGKSYENA